MSAYARVSFSSVKARLTDRVGATSADSRFWSDAEKADAFNEALCVWQALTGDFTRAFTIPVLPASGADVPFVNVPRQISSVQRVLYGTTPLQLISLHELDNGYIGWQYTTGTPLYWTPVGLNVVALYPAPTSGTLTFEGLTEGIRLISDGDFVNLGDEELTRLLDYARFYAAFKEGTGEFTAASPALKRLMEAAALRNSRLKKTNTYRRAMGIHRDEEEGMAPRDGEDSSFGVRA
jgi:hypothetical protein